jgi:hypothetical protein
MANKELMKVKDAMRCLPVTRFNETIFIPLPVDLWRRCDETGMVCCCPVCKEDGSRGYWDTIAVSRFAAKGRNDFTWTVHYPALHDVSIRRTKAREDVAAKGEVEHLERTFANETIFDLAVMLGADLTNNALDFAKSGEFGDGWHNSRNHQDYLTEWANEFNTKNAGREWDGEYMEEIEEFYGVKTAAMRRCAIV